MGPRGWVRATVVAEEQGQGAREAQVQWGEETPVQGEPAKGTGLGLGNQEQAHDWCDLYLELRQHGRSRHTRSVSDPLSTRCSPSSLLCGHASGPTPDPGSTVREESSLERRGRRHLLRAKANPRPQLGRRRSQPPQPHGLTEGRCLRPHQQHGRLAVLVSVHRTQGCLMQGPLRGWAAQLPGFPGLPASPLKLN